MAYLSVTRLRLRSPLYFPQAAWRIFQIYRQTIAAPGFIEGRLLRDAHRTLWTVTAWTDSKTMRTFRSSGAHRQVMPQLAQWCDEAAVAHWEQADAELPTWQEAYEHLLQQGRASPVNHPSPQHASLAVAAPQRISRTRELPLHPKVRVPS